MSYQVIARKWRPQKFSDMVGQEHLARTLKNAITSGRIAHAYLFVGPRGIGKTTTARIFAKAINCLNPIDGEPCCRCASCRSIADETNVDVIEIDAATHTQVEKARELCEEVLHLPIASKYKIYIIDEVHMLSKNAWNALLKTIEEPPAHAKFIFATTEVQKVLPTVISRCQRFDLRRIKGEDITARLRLICDTENVKISDGALRIIARAADGGMRDAQSLLDQMISFFGTGDNTTGITEDQALSLFGLAASADMEMLLRAIVTNDRGTAITAIHRFAEAGKNLEVLYEEILAWLRGILLCRIVDRPAEILEESAERIALYQNIAAVIDPGAVQRLMEQLSASGYLLREAINKQVFMESILLKAMRIAHAVQVEDLIARLNQLRNAGELDAVRSVVPIYEMPRGQIVVPKDSKFAPALNRAVETKIVTEEEASRLAVTAAEAEVPEKKTSVETVTPAAAEEKTEEIPAVEQTETEEHTMADVVQEVTVDTVREMFTPPASEEPAEEQIIPDAVPELVVESPDEETDLPDPEIPDENGAEQSAPPQAAGADRIWQSLILDIRDNLKKDFLASAMMEATPISFDRNALVAAFDNEYEVMPMMIVEKEHSLLTKRLADLLKRPVTLYLDRRSGLASPQQVRERENIRKLKEDTVHDPFVQEALDLFGGRVADAFSSAELSENKQT